MECPEGSIKAIVEQSTFAGSSILYRLRLPSGLIVESLFNSHAEYAVGDEVRIQVKADHLILFKQHDQDMAESII